MERVFTGFDSAWGATNKGGLCDMVFGNTDSLMVTSLKIVDWNQAIDEVKNYRNIGLHVFSIDQPICVANETGCRPVEIGLSRALMRVFGCGAHSSNLNNPCWGPNARIWDFLRELEARNYCHEPMAVPNIATGKFFFECYPHPALIGLFGLNHLLPYKKHRRDVNAWNCLLKLLISLKDAQLAISNIENFISPQMRQTKSNEDRLDAIICAYTSAYWWRFGATRSTMIGNLASGYMVTPHSEAMQQLLVAQFGDDINRGGRVHLAIRGPSA